MAGIDDGAPPQIRGAADEENLFTAREPDIDIELFMLKPNANDQAEPSPAST